MKAKLGEIYNLQMGKTPARNNPMYWNNGDNDWVSIGDLGTFNKYVGRTKETISNAAVQETGIKLVPANTVIMSFKLSIGKTAITVKPTYTNEAIMAFIPTGKYEILPEYAYYLFSGRDWSEGSNKAVMGLTLNKATLMDIEITVPSLETQRDAIEKLNKISDVISVREEQLCKLDELVKSRFIELFGDPVVNTKGLKKLTMKAVCTKITDGEHGSVQRFENGHPFLNAKHIKPDGTIDWSTVTRTSDEIHQKIYKRCNPEAGDILMTTTGTIGNVAVVPESEPFSMDRGITLMKLDLKQVLPVFIVWLLRFDSMQNIMEANVHASAIGHLFLNKVEQLPVIIPEMEIQQQFAAFVQSTDKSKADTEKVVNEMITEKYILMKMCSSMMEN